MINWILRMIKPVVKWIGSKRIPFTKKLVTGWHYYDMRQHLEAGDILLTTTFGELSNLINAGEFKHAAMYVGGKKIKYVVEAIGRGTVQTDLVSFLLRKDLFVVLKPKFATDIDRINAVKEMNTYIGEEYDFYFVLDNKGAKYCSEAVYSAYTKALPDLELKKEKVAGEIIIRPMNFYEDVKNWKISYDSRDRKAK